MNIIARLEYELAYYDSAVHRFNHYTTRTPLLKKLYQGIVSRCCSTHCVQLTVVYCTVDKTWKKKCMRRMNNLKWLQLHSAYIIIIIIIINGSHGRKRRNWRRRKKSRKKSNVKKDVKWNTDKVFSYAFSSKFSFSNILQFFILLNIFIVCPI